MNIKIKITALFFLPVTILLSSCCKEGIDGDSTVIITPKHHGGIIKNHIGYPDTVFVKFNAEELPGTAVSDFDTYFVGVTGEKNVVCKGLKCGKYFLYVTGMDSSGPYRVSGGVALKIKYKDRKDKIEMDVAITE